MAEAEKLFEKYRPAELGEIVGQARAVKQIGAILARGWGGRGYWISGASGTGKTTLAKIIAAHGAEEFYTQQLNGRRLTLAELDRIEYETRGRPLGAKGGWAYIIDEVHRVRRDVLGCLLTTLEKIPPYVVWIFTTTNEAQEGLFEDDPSGDCQGPLMSRCLQVALTNQGLSKAFGAHVKRIAEAEGLNGQPMAAYEKLAQKCRNNCRAMLQAVEAGRMLA